MFFAHKLLLQPDTKYETAFESSTAGTYTLKISAGYYTVELVGGGAGGAYFDAKYYGGWSNWRCSTGGSGAYLKAVLTIRKSDTITITVGGLGGFRNGTGWGQFSGNGGDSSIKSSSGNILVCAGGGKGSGNIFYGEVTGAGGSNIINTEAKILINKSGAAGHGTTGWHVNVSQYNGLENGFGASGKAYADGDDGHNAANTGTGNGNGHGGYVKIMKGKQ